MASFTNDGGKYSGGATSAYTFGVNRPIGASAPGISYFRNRMYDQATGRFIQEDPAGVAGGINLYQYSGNSPANFTDPFGLFKLDVEVGAQMYVDLCRQKSATCNADFRRMENSKIVYHVQELGQNDAMLNKRCISGCTSEKVVQNTVTIQVKPSDFAGSESGLQVKVDGTIVVGHEAGHAVTVTRSGTGCTDPTGCAKAHENVIRKELGSEYGQRP